MNGKSKKSWGLIFIIILFFFIINSCYTIVDEDKLRTNNHPEANNNPIDYRSNIPKFQEVSGNGIIAYVIPGSTPEIKSHIGYVLKNPEWEKAPEDERLRFYLEPEEIAARYLDEPVYVRGKLLKVPGKRINSYTFDAPYTVIMIDKIYLINQSSMRERPDLIISSIFSERKIQERHHYPGGTPQRYTPERPSYEYRITVMNIGKEIIADPFYVVWGNVGAGEIKPKYSGYFLVNEERNIIPINGSIEIRFTFGDNDGRRFLVNPQSIEYYPFIPESNYDNNIYLY